MPIDVSSILAPRQSLLDYQQLQAQFDQKKQDQMLQQALVTHKLTDPAGGGQVPAAIQLANEYQKARSIGDTQRMNDLAVFAKSFDKGVVTDANGNATTIGGYAPAVSGIQGSIAGAKEAATQGVDIQTKPIIAGREATAKNQSELQFANPISTARKTGEVNASQQADVNKRAISAGNNISVINDILTPDTSGRTVLDRATGSTLGAFGAGANKFIGHSNEATQANSQLQVLGGQLLNNVPRMEGPQSDRDVESYREQAGKIADPTIPAGDKKAALYQIKALSQKYASLNQSPVQSIPDSPGMALPGANKAIPGLGGMTGSDVNGAKLAPDGHYYLPDPNRAGKYLRVDR